MEVISTRRYEARPQADSHASILVDPTNAVATVKEEEWETRKKKEITTTRQIETRVKRQVVLEDGEVVVDSGPLVTTNTTEDVEQQEQTTQERRTTGDEPQKVEWPAGTKPGGPVVQKELNETVMKSREEIEELLETEDRQQLGDISDEAYLQAVRNNRGDLRVALAESQRQLQREQQHQGPRVLQHTTRSNKVVDTEKTLERSELKQDGQIVTERKTTVEHEEIKDDELPEARDVLPDEARETRKQATQRYVKRRDEDIVDYVSNGERVGREMRFVSETTEAERTGDWPGDQPGIRPGRKHGFSSSETKAQTTQQTTASSRKENNNNNNANRSKNVEVGEEDEARKFETSKWLESHFGSESRSSQGSIDDDTNVQPNGATTTNTSYINVTMKSTAAPPARERIEREHYKQTTKTTTKQHQSSRTTTNGRESISPSGYFQGISEWSERYQSTEKQNSHSRSKSPQYIMETTARETNRTNGHHRSSPAPEIPRSHKESSYSRNYETSRHHQERRSPPHERPKVDPPSPPIRRKAKEQVVTTKTERSYHQEAVPRAPSVERTASPVHVVHRTTSPVHVVHRTSSPVHVVQRTWESRSRDERDHEQRRGRSSNVNGSAERSTRRHHEYHHQQHHHSPERTRHRPRSPESRSPSPSLGRSSPARRDNKKDDHSRPSKSPSPSKYKIGESFRKLVGKLRSASSERNKKRPGSSSTSQLTQTDEDSTYRQYNSVDRNIPLGPDYDTDDRPPERPPRSPRTHQTSSTTTHTVSVNASPPREVRSSHTSKYRAGSPRHADHRSGSPRHADYRSASPRHADYRSASPRHAEYREVTTTHSSHRNDQPISRYYLGEDPYGSIYGKEKGYKETKVHSSRHRSRHADEEHSNESGSLGRFSKSTSRLQAHDFDQPDYERTTSAQTLPRKMQQSSSSREHHSTTTKTTRRVSNGHSSSPGVSRFISNNNAINSSYHSNNNNNNNYVSNGKDSKQYGSMINVSFKNQVTSPPKTTHYVQTSINTTPPKTFKSTLSRSKSFNVEINADDGTVSTPKTNGFSNGTSNNSSYIKSTTHINKLTDEAAPLKSPGILASISRNNINRDLMRNGRHDY